MILNNHSSLDGKHALLSPSKYHWIFDSDEEFEKRFCTTYSAEIGTLLHSIARKHIKFGYRINKNDKRSILVELLDNGIPVKVLEAIDFDSMYENLCTYVNDCISFRMSPEVILYFSDICFGTADALNYDEKKRFLRIHDLKTGSTTARMEQLYIYTALFFLEYRFVKPGETNIELRIYQKNEVYTDSPSADVIVPIMDKIKHFNDICNVIRNDR